MIEYFCKYLRFFFCVLFLNKANNTYKTKTDMAANQNKKKNPPPNLSKQSPDTVTGAYVLALALRVLTGKAASLVNVKFASKVKFQATYHCEISDEKLDLKSAIESNFNALVDKSLPISIRSVTEPPKELPQGLAEPTHPDLVSFAVKGFEEHVGYSAVSVIDNTGKKKKKIDK
ncbi:hypothetical protein RFI_19851 [Reticulomyxa filosa]|uniref:Uncharacterized protein n=1 Tax=Reticulomyxa filosa TaxID=46433 RepID=X6MVK2_RETFI|nr:hypothetical protein RFI_19851 [Reticulomyxa filosa]|eukprot:ETO17472.1 hypothetical protein RFI_19851 [Reticulomyxa filosa]